VGHKKCEKCDVNKVTPHQALLVLGRLTVCRQVNNTGM